MRALLKGRTQRPGNLIVSGVHLRCGKRWRCGEVQDRRVVSKESTDSHGATYQSSAASCYLAVASSSA